MSDKIKILCVEDNPGDARLIQEFFNDDTSNHYEISFAVNLENVRKIISDKIFDVVLLDLSLPDSSGLNTLEIVQSLVMDTPIIVLTGLQDELTAEKTIQFGAQDYLLKNNISTDLLAHSVKYAIDRHVFTKKLAENQKQYQLLIEKNSDGILVVNKEGIINFVNPAAEILIGRSAEELLHHSFGFPVSANGGTEISLLGKGGKVKTVEMRLSDIKWEDAPCYLALLRDITERKELEQKSLEYNQMLEQAGKDKDKFFSIIAHDLRSPLSSFLGITELMAEDLPSMNIETLKELVLSMKGSAENLHRLLENLLQWAKIQRGLVPFDPEKVSLAEIMNDALTMIQESARTKNITINFNVPDDLDVFADTNILQTVLRNLISNAVKFTRKGGHISLNAKVLDSENAEVSILDSGIGICPAMLDTLFDISNKSGRKGTEGEPSSGLGLILCKEFIEILGGKMKVESEVGVGSNFSFTIPIHAASEQIVDQASIGANQIELIKPDGLNVLIADDDEGSLKLIALIVKSFAAKVIRVKNGLEEVDAFTKNTDIDLIITDIHMPKMDGYEAVRRIRQMNRKVIIIALTDFAQTGEKEIAREAGCTDYMSKPIKKAELMDIIQKYFKK